VHLNLLKVYLLKRVSGSVEGLNILGPNFFQMLLLLWLLIEETRQNFQALIGEDFQKLSCSFPCEVIGIFVNII
jgi:hypothetical protein